MTHNPNPDQVSYSSNRMEAEETLRLLAKLAPPESLTDRVHARVRHQIALQNSAPEHRGFWSLWSPGKRLQFAGAAVLAIAVAGSMWTVNRSHSAGPVPAGPQIAAPATPESGFSGAKASRVPATLNPIKVPATPKKKPKGPSKPANKVSSAVTNRVVAAQPESEPNR